VLRERDEVREEFDQGTHRSQQALRPPKPLGWAALMGCLNGAVALDALELFDTESRPKIGMFPSERTDGLANA
jgi:hypothetical protein